MAVKVWAHPLFTSSLSQVVLYRLSDQVEGRQPTSGSYRPTPAEIQDVVDRIGGLSESPGDKGPRPSENDVLTPLERNAASTAFWAPDSPFDLPFLVGYRADSNGDFEFDTVDSVVYEDLIIEEWIINRNIDEYARRCFIEHHFTLSPTPQAKNQYLDLIDNLLERSNKHRQERVWLDFEISDEGYSDRVAIELRRLTDWCRHERAYLKSQNPPSIPTPSKEIPGLSLKEKALLIILLQEEGLLSAYGDKVSRYQYYGLLASLTGGQSDTIYNYVKSIDGAEGSNSDALHPTAIANVKQQLSRLGFDETHGFLEKWNIKLKETKARRSKGAKHVSPVKKD